MDDAMYRGETIDYQLFPVVTGEERVAALNEIRSRFTSERADELLAELEDIEGEFDRELHQSHNCL